MSETVTGTITKVRKDRKGFFIDGNWYSVFDSSEMDGVNKGSTVTFTFKKKGEWNNIDNGTIKETAPPAASGGGKSYGGGGGNSQFRSVPELNRIDGLRFAVETVVNLTSSNTIQDDVKQVLKIAAVYTAYIEGSIGAPAGAAAPAPEANDADAAAKAAAEAAAQAEREAAAKAAEEAAKAQQAAGQSALDDFLA